MNAIVNHLKTCTGCRIAKLPGEFYVGKGGRPRARCKSCHNAQVKARRNSPEGRAVRREAIRKRRRDSALQVWQDRARGAVTRAIRAGRLRPASVTPCSEASSRCSGRRELHHDDYRRPSWLKVRCLCDYHHKEAHALAEPVMPPDEILERWFEGVKAEREARRARQGKLCGGCNTPKTGTEFFRDKSRRDGLDSICKVCRHKRRHRCSK